MKADDKYKKTITIVRRGKTITKTVWCKTEKADSSKRINYARDTREIHAKLVVGQEYISHEFGAVRYIGRSMSDGRLEFKILDPKYNGKKMRLTAEEYKKGIA